MDNKKIPYLCGGTFFFLLVQAKKPRAKAREREKGISDGLKDPAMMGGLIQAITGNDTYAYERSLKKNTSQFRECRIDGSIYIPFNDLAVAKSYDNDVANNYTAALLRMMKFADDFLDTAKAEWLLRVLLDVIKQDSHIERDAHFCVQRSGVSLSKSDLLSTSYFEFQPFLVGIIHYILMNRSDNISGQATLDEWGIKKNERSERKLRDNFSLGATQTATVEWLVYGKQNTNNSAAKAEEKSKNNEEPTDDEVINDKCADDSNQDYQKNKSVTVIRQQTNVVQYGEKSVNLVNNGTININL